MVPHLPVVTLLAAGLLGLVFVSLSIMVVRARMTQKVMLGDGEDGAILVAVRAHANFAEYVPICLLLIGGLEWLSGPTILVKVLANVLVLARLAHPIGLFRPAPNPFRAGGFVGTTLVLLVASLAVLATLL